MCVHINGLRAQFMCMHATVWRKILTGENIDEFLSIRQHFPHQNFPLIIFCRLHTRPLFRAGGYH